MIIDGKVTKEQFYIFINDIIKYLSKYINTKNIERKFYEAEYILTDKYNNDIIVGEKIYSKEKVEKYTGITKFPNIQNFFGFESSSPICLVRNLPNDQEFLKNIMFHELMHVGSSEQEVISRKKLVFKAGLFKIIYNSNFSNYVSNYYRYLNEAMTELTAKFIYDKIYDDNYKIVNFKDEECITGIYGKSYFLLAFLLLNYFEDHPDILFNIYFNNNIKLFEKVLKKNTKFNLEKLNEQIISFQQNPYDLDDKYRKIIKEINDKNPLKNKDVIYQYNL